jgi:hypothetical protein
MLFTVEYMGMCQNVHLCGILSKSNIFRRGKLYKTVYMKDELITRLILGRFTILRLKSFRKSWGLNTPGWL